jgi:hypothetical protein
VLKEQKELFKNDEHRVRMLQLMNVIRLANQQPQVRNKLEEARKEVHDYVRRTSPDLLPYLEKMDAPRDLSRKQNQLTEIIFSQTRMRLPIHRVFPSGWPSRSDVRDHLQGGQAGRAGNHQDRH